MSEPESAGSVLEAVASHPKVAAASASVGIGLSGAAQLSMIDGWLARGSMTIGILTGAVVLFIQLIRLEREWKARKTDETSANYEA